MTTTTATVQTTPTITVETIHAEAGAVAETTTMVEAEVETIGSGTNLIGNRNNGVNNNNLGTHPTNHGRQTTGSLSLRWLI